MTGDAQFCKKCFAVFNVTSVLTEADGKQIWQCEFCNHKNVVEIDEAEMPKEDAVNYILQAAAQVEDAAEDTGMPKSDKISVVFCIDISYSMRN